MRRQLLPALLVTICLLVLLSVVYPLAVWAVGQVAFPGQTDGSLVHANGHVVGSALIGQSFTDKNGNPLPRYFQPRPSAAGSGYDPTASGGSNLGPSNPLLVGYIGGFNTPIRPDGTHLPTNPYATASDPTCVPTDAKGNPIAPETAAGIGAHQYAKAPDGSYVCDPNTVPERVTAYRAFNRLPADAQVPVDAVTASGSGLDPDISEANALIQAPRVARVRGLDTARIVTLVHAHVRTRAWGILGENTINVLDLNVALDGLR